MNLSTKRRRKIKKVLLLVVLLFTLAFHNINAGATDILEDDFNDNSRNLALWDYIVWSWQGTLSETNQRLEYTSPGTTTGSPDDTNGAYYRLKSTQSYNNPWSITLDVHVEGFNGPAYYHEYGMDIGILNTGDANDKIWFGRYRGYYSAIGGYYNSWCVFKSTNGTDQLDSFFDAAGNDGTMKLVWDGTYFKLYYKQGPDFVALNTNLSVGDWGMDADSTFTILIGGYDDECDFILDDGAKLYCDNFRLCQEPDTDIEIDIKPGSCPNPLNVNSKGVLPVAILGTEDFDVFDIYVASVRMEGISPIRSGYEDVATPFEGEICECHELGADGYLDLTLKFTTQEIIDAIGDVNDGDEVILTISGKLSNGRDFEGADCVIIIKKGSKKK